MRQTIYTHIQKQVTTDLSMVFIYSSEVKMPHGDWHDTAYAQVLYNSHYLLQFSSVNLTNKVYESMENCLTYTMDYTLSIP